MGECLEGGRAFEHGERAGAAVPELDGVLADEAVAAQHLQAVVGVRFDRFDVDFHNNRTQSDFTSTDHLLSPRAGLIVKPVEAVSLYTGYTLTYLPFVARAFCDAVDDFPNVNASVVDESLVVHRDVHLGVAVDLDFEGLIAPVVRDADRKGVFELARELAEISKLAREKKLKPGDMQGGTFSISSLGGIGGSNFTPIINAPEVAILGVSRSAWQPVYRDLKFVPRLMLPLSLSYDHRVIDGAKAVRFTTRLAEILASPGQLVEAIP